MLGVLGRCGVQQAALGEVAAVKEVGAGRGDPWGRSVQRREQPGYRLSHEMQQEGLGLKWREEGGWTCVRQLKIL